MQENWNILWDNLEQYVLEIKLSKKIQVFLRINLRFQSYRSLKSLRVQLKS